MSSFDRSGPNYLKAAFANVYNLSLLGGALTASALTGEYVVGAVALGLEALWLLLGPDLRLFRRSVDQAEREAREEAEKKRLEQLTQNLPQREWQRAQALQGLQDEIKRDMEHNPSFQAVLLQTELDKLSRLFHSFVHLAAACARAETYLAAHNPRELERQVEIQKGLAEGHADATAKALAKKNVQVLERRRATISDISNFLARARGQMTLIENTVRLLRDQVLTMASPNQLGDELDDLLTGVDAIQQSARDHQEVFGGVAELMEPIAPIAEEGAEAKKSKRSTRVR